MIREIIKKYAQFEGIEVSEAEDGFEAVQMGRALLNEPGFVNRMRQEEEARCSCKHSNYCIARMYSIEMACHQRLPEGELPQYLKKEIDRIERKG